MSDHYRSNPNAGAAAGLIVIFVLLFVLTIGFLAGLAVGTWLT